MLPTAPARSRVSPWPLAPSRISLQLEDAAGRGTAPRPAPPAPRRPPLPPNPTYFFICPYGAGRPYGMLRSMYFWAGTPTPGAPITSTVQTAPPERRCVPGAGKKEPDQLATGFGPLQPAAAAHELRHPLPLTAPAQGRSGPGVKSGCREREKGGAQSGALAGFLRLPGGEEAGGAASATISRLARGRRQNRGVSAVGKCPVKPQEPRHSREEPPARSILPPQPSHLPSEAVGAKGLPAGTAPGSDPQRRGSSSPALAEAATSRGNEKVTLGKRFSKSLENSLSRRALPRSFRQPLAPQAQHRLVVWRAALPRWVSGDRALSLRGGR